MAKTTGKIWKLSLQRTLMASREQVWRALQADSAPRAGRPFALRDGICGVIRKVEMPRLLRLSVDGGGRETSTLEIELAAQGRERTALRFHHHGLSDQPTREAFRQRWSDGLARLASSLD